MDGPLVIAPFFDGLPLETTIRDALTDSDLDSIVAAYAGRWHRTLAIGARGLGGALARAIGGDAPKGNPRPAIAATATLFAFGSTDPITLAQIEALPAGVGIREAPGGEAPAPDTLRLPLVLQITGEHAGPAKAVAERFAEGVADYAAACGPANLVMGGGDTDSRHPSAAGSARGISRGRSSAWPAYIRYRPVRWQAFAVRGEIRRLRRAGCPCWLAAHGHGRSWLERRMLRSCR